MFHYRSDYSRSAFILLFVMFACSFMLAGSAVAAGEESEVIAMVNDRPITKTEFYTSLEDAYGHSMLTQMIVDALVEEAAEDWKITISDAMVQQQFNSIRANYESEEAFQKALENNAYTEDSLKHQIRVNYILDTIAYSGVTVSEQEVQDYFEANKQKLGTPAQSLVKHILVDTKEEAENLLKQLKEGADFAALAKEHSMDRASAENGGSLGYVSDDEAIVAEFRAAMDNLLVGELSEPVKSQFGWHIILITERKLPQPAQLEKVRATIENAIAQEKARSYEEILQELYAQYKVSVNWERYKSLGNN